MSIYNSNHQLLSLTAYIDACEPISMLLVKHCVAVDIMVTSAQQCAVVASVRVSNCQSILSKENSN